MSNKQKKSRKPSIALIKTASAVLAAVYYAALVCILLSGIVALIMLLVNTPAEQMLLPPFMKLEDNVYSITIGNGIRIDSAYDSVTLSDIKTVIYGQLLMFACSCAIIAPVSLFFSKMLKNLSAGEHGEKIARYITFIGLSVLVGSPILRLADDFYNYLLVKTFAENPESIRFAFALPLGGIAVGAMIMVISGVYSLGTKKETAIDTVQLEENKE